MSVLAFAAPASAQVPPSAIDQYVEDPPDAGGRTPKGGTGSSSSLPPRIATQVRERGGDDAELLAAVATSSIYGAPTGKVRKTSRGDADLNLDGLDPDGAADPQVDVSAGDTFSAAVGAVEGGGGARLLVLLLALVAITGAALAASGLRQRRGSR